MWQQQMEAARANILRYVDMGIADQNCTATHNYGTTTQRNRKDTNNGKNHFFQIPRLGHRKLVV